MAVDPAAVLALRPTLMDQQQLQAAFEQKQQLAAFQEALLSGKVQNLANGGGQTPAAIQIANEIAKRQQAGDYAGASLLAQTSKIYDHGVGLGTDGSAVQVQGYAPAAASIQGAISGAKELAQKQVDIQANPIIAGGEANARNASELSFAGATQTAKSTAENAAKQISTLQTKADSANETGQLTSQARTILQSGNPNGSYLGAGAAAGKRLVGISDATTQANERLNNIAARLTASQPRFEGPQSDADRAFYTQMAGNVADKTKPIKDRLSALDEMDRLNSKYIPVKTATKDIIGQLSGDSALPNVASPALNMLPGNAPNPVAAQPAAQQSTDRLTPEQAAMLPSGTPFTDVNGKARVRH